MADIFDKWDKSIDTAGLAADVEEAAANGGQGTFKDVDPGQYEVAVNRMELKSSKAGDPMVSIWFKIVSDGEFKGQLIFMNQVITQGFQIHIVNELLRSLVAEAPDPPVVEFKSYKQYSNLILDVQELITDNFEYALDYGKNNKGYNTFKITEVFVLED